MKQNDSMENGIGPMAHAQKMSCWIHWVQWELWTQWWQFNDRALKTVPIGDPRLKFTCKFCILLRMKEKIKQHLTPVPSVKHLLYGDFVKQRWEEAEESELSTCPCLLLPVIIRKSNFMCSILDRSHCTCTEVHGAEAAWEICAYPAGSCCKHSLHSDSLQR